MRKGAAVQGRAMPSGSIHGPQGKFLFYCLKLNVGIQLHLRVAPPPEDPFSGLVQDRLASASPLPRPQAQHAARAARPTGQSPEWPGPVRVKNCSAAGGGDLSPPASASSVMPAAVPSQHSPFLPQRSSGVNGAPWRRERGLPPACPGLFRHSTDTSWENCCQLDPQCLDLVLPHW